MTNWSENSAVSSKSGAHTPVKHLKNRSISHSPHPIVYP
jgi:hypothetical protein